MWHEAVVRVLMDHSDDNPDPLHGGQPIRSPQVMLIIPENTSKKSNVTFVDDICAAIEAARCDNERVEFVRDALLPLKLRMLLALRLASNLLQLLQTQWLRNAWSKDNIYFLLRPIADATGGSQDQLYIDFSRPFVSLVFDGNDGSAAPQKNVEPKIALLELGILLLEIWHERTLETKFSLKEAPSGYYERLLLASRWLDETDDPLLTLYDKATSHCIRGMIGGETRLRTWEDIKFLADHKVLF